MDSYNKTELQEFQQSAPKQHYYAPFKMDQPDYGAKVQCGRIDDSTPLNINKICYFQKVVYKSYS